MNADVFLLFSKNTSFSRKSLKRNMDIAGSANMELAGWGQQNILLHHVMTEVEVEGMESKWTRSYRARICQGVQTSDNTNFRDAEVPADIEMSARSKVSVAKRGTGVIAALIVDDVGCDVLRPPSSRSLNVDVSLSSLLAELDKGPVLAVRKLPLSSEEVCTPRETRCKTSDRESARVRRVLPHASTREHMSLVHSEPFPKHGPLFLRRSVSNSF